MGYAVKVVRTDAESVFIHGAFAKHCEQSKISISHSSPYLKETNGQAERYFGVIMDMTRAFLKTANMPHKFWPLAVRHATYVKNRVPSAALGGRTPYEMVYGVVPSIEHIRIFGSKVSAWIPPEQRGSKLSDRAWTGSLSRIVCQRTARPN
mmetsp:Transcript_43488/g.81435  ORF Transcript_43488/g.81435 Transcript_43488/m.81435 type:complete len:151 (+) Transcript_43488:653-1105(+)